MPLPVWPLVLSVAAFCAVLLLVLWKGKHFPWLVLGLGWYLLGLLTTIVLAKMGIQIAMANRFAYFPYVGAYLVVVLGAREVASRLIADKHRLHLLLALCFLALLGWYWTQASFAIQFWRNKYTIYERAIAVTPGHHILYNNYGKILLDRQDFGLAETYVLKALTLQPNYNLALGNLGDVYMATGRFEQAIDMFRRALAADPNNAKNADYHFDMAKCLAQLARYSEAEQSYHQTLAIQPNDPEAHNDLGNIALVRGNLRQAEEHYARAVALDPDYRVAQDNLRRVQRALAGVRQ
jgi:tetratricopeptide (TPR) repeat protein